MRKLMQTFCHFYRILSFSLFFYAGFPSRCGSDLLYLTL